MVQSTEDYSLQNISNRINWRRSQTSILHIKFPGLFCWRAIYENSCKGLHESTESCWSSFQDVNLERQSPLVVFLRDKTILDFFGRMAWRHVCNTRTCTQEAAYFHVFLEKDCPSLCSQGKNIMFAEKKIPSFQIIQERSCPSTILFEKTIFSEHLKKISHFRVFF